MSILIRIRSQVQWEPTGFIQDINSLTWKDQRQDPEWRKSRTNTMNILISAERKKFFFFYFLSYFCSLQILRIIIHLSIATLTIFHVINIMRVMSIQGRLTR